MNFMFDPRLLVFAGLATVLSMAPGTTTILVTRSVLIRGRNAGFTVILGGTLGVYVHAALSAFGLSFILLQSQVLFNAVKFLGACYLIFLGLQTLWRAFRKQSDLLSVLNNGDDSPDVGVHRKSFIEGLVTIVLSPEALVFYMAVIPQFIRPGESVLWKSFLLATIHALVRFLWYAAYTLFLARMLDWHKRPFVQKGIQLSRALFLILFGIRLALSKK
ncbi:MAG: LysE family translocator [Desulfobacteraceae bacterium]|nr:MAG: LysE family translocator [Desulfobacteraceae bacterium]